MGDSFQFDFENSIAPQQNALPSSVTAPTGQDVPPYIAPGTNIGQSIGSYTKNFRRTVCTFWLRGLCMKGDTCGFLHQLDASRMPVCRTFARTGQCREADCPYKHDIGEVPECNMYKLGFCIYGPICRYRHTYVSTPPPDPSTVDAAKPKEFRSFQQQQNERPQRRRRQDDYNGGGGQLVVHGQQPNASLPNADVLHAVGQSRLQYGF